MIKRIFDFYRNAPMRVNVGAFVLGGAFGIVLWYLGAHGIISLEQITGALMPLGNVLLLMLKMIVIPLIFFSLVCGTASLPLHQFGKMGIAVILWYLATSFYASTFGATLSYLFSPNMQIDQAKSATVVESLVKTHNTSAQSPFVDLLYSLFDNPFHALANGDFLPIIVFSIIFGLATRAILDSTKDAEQNRIVGLLLDVFNALQAICFKLIDWVMCYFPIGVFVLTAMNFANHGIGLFSSYAQISACVIIAVLLMIFICYPLFILIICRENPYPIMWKLREPILTAFVTRSSAATLPVSLSVAKSELKVNSGLSGFTLPLGATVNMDGACIHLPVFAILAANIFGIDLSMWQLMIIVVSIVFASVGAGGIPGGSIFLLFMVLEKMGLTVEQTALIVSLAMGINPLMDMFETACNVAGDNVGNYIIAKRLKMIGD